MGETLDRDRADLAALAESFPALVARYHDAARTAREIERQERALTPATPGEQSQDRPVTSFTTLAAQARVARAALDAVLAEIRTLPGYNDFLLPPSYPEIAATARPCLPLVYLVVTPEGSLTLIVPWGAAEPEVLWIDSFTERDLTALLITREDGTVVGGYLPAQLQDASLLGDELQRTLPILGTRLIGPIAERLWAMNAGGVTLIPTGLLGLLPLHAATYQLDGATVCLLDQLDVAYAPSARLLATAQHEQRARAGGVRLAGVGNPLPGAATGDWARRELQRTLPAIRRQVAALLPQIETAARAAAPAAREPLERLARLWQTCLTRLEHLMRQSPEQIITAGRDVQLAAALFADLPGAVGQPLVAIAARMPPSLQYARSELIGILNLLPLGAATPLYEHAATRHALWQLLPEATIAHFACHGQFGTDDPLDSALLLADDTRLTLRELIVGDTRALARLRLVVLSACQTAITEFRRVPDESMGLPGGFLLAGVPAVVGTLWSVDDLSTALLMHRFYELHLRGDRAQGLEPQPPARALRAAQCWLRDVTYAELFVYCDHHRALAVGRDQPTRVRMPTNMMLEGRELAEEADDLTARPYADPVFWAPFTFAGAMEETTHGR